MAPTPSVVSSAGSEMGLPPPTTASSAVDKQLKSLCLREFPCGLGTWREPEREQLKPAKLGRPRIKPIHHRFKSDPDSLDSLKVSAHMDKSEVLQELVNSPFSPWHLDYSWSEEAKQLREIAVKSPWLIDQNFVLNQVRKRQTGKTGKTRKKQTTPQLRVQRPLLQMQRKIKRRRRNQN